MDKTVETPVIMIVPVDPMDRPEPVRDIPYEPSEGMIPFPCEGCGNKGWYGIRQAMLKTQKPQTPILCVVCVVKMGKEAQARGEEVTSRVHHLGGP
jgi:hypothetical protein